MASKCQSGKCLERAAMYYDQNVAGLLGTPRYNTIKETAGVSSSDPAAKDYAGPHARYEEYGHSPDSWDIHGLLQEKGAKQIYAYPLKQKDGNNLGTLEYTKVNNKFKKKPLEEREQFYRDMKMPIGSLVGLGMKGGSGAHYGTKSYNKQKGLVSSNHSAVVVGYDETGLPYIYDWSKVRPITETYLGMMVTNITSPKEVGRFTYDYLQNTGELADTYRPLKLKVSDKETNSDYDVDEFDPFIKALEDNKLEISNSLGIDFNMYDELAKRAVATAISETEGGNNNIWRFGAGAGPLRIAPSYITDKLGFGNTTGITQINEDLIWARVGTEEQRKGNRMPGKLNALGIEEKTYDPWDPEQQAKATIAFLYDNLEVGRKNLKSGVNKETGSRNKLDLPDEQVGYYQWFQPNLMGDGVAWGESEKVKNFAKAYAKVSLGYSDQSTEETPTVLSPPASDSRQYGGNVEQDPLYTSLLNTFQNGGKIESYQGGTEVLENIYKNYPGLKNLGEVTLKPDTSFTREKTGIGDIEYFSPTQDSVRYSNYTVPHPSIGTHGILYNPNTNTEQNIALDMLHGMSSADPKYKKLRNNLKKKILSSKFNNDLEHYWKEHNSKFKENDGKEKFVDNYVDGIIRGLLFEGSDEDFENARYSREANEEYLKNKEINNEFDKLNSYIKGYENGGEVLPEQPTQQELPHQEIVSFPTEREPAGDPRVPRSASVQDYYTNLENTPIPKTISKKYKIWEDTYKSPMGLPIKSYKNIYDIQAFFNSGDWKEDFKNIENYRKSSHPMIGSVDPKTNTFIPSEENLNTNEEIASHIDINAIPVNFKKVERIPINPDGFAPGSATEFADKVVIPSGNITMKDMQEPILANGEMLMPGEEAQFDTDYVVEEKLPKAQDGLTVTAPDKLITYNDKQGNRISFTGDSRKDNWINDQLDTGKFGYNEKTGALTRLQTPQKGISEEDTLLKNKGKYREHIGNRGFTTSSQDSKIANLSKEEQKNINTINKKERQDYVFEQQQEMFRNPITYAPGVVAGAMLGGPAVAAAGDAAFATLAPYASAAWNTNIPGALGMSSVPGATVGNLINAGFGTHGVTHIAPDTKNLIENPSLENALHVGIDALEMAPMYGPMSKMLGELGTIGRVGKSKTIPLTHSKKGGFKGDFLKDKTLIGEGSEFTVYKDTKGNVFKIGEAYNSPETFNPRIEQALKLNEIGGVPTELVGHWKSPNGIMNPIFKQPFIKGKKATQKEIDTYFKNKGFNKIKDGTYSNSKSTISDIDPDNVIIDSNNKVNIIDAFIEPTSAAGSAMKTSTPKNIDELLTLPEDEILNLTGKDKWVWENFKNSSLPKERIEKELARALSREESLISQFTVPQNKVPKETRNLVKEGRKDAINWIESDEWLKRRIKATGESKEQAEAMRKTMLEDLKSTTVDFKNVQGKKVSEQGFKYIDQEGTQRIALGFGDDIINKNLRGNAEHEFIHAATTNPRAFQGIKMENIYPEITKDLGPNMKTFLEYLNKNPEKQVRGVKALQHLKKSGKWDGSSEITDDMVNSLMERATNRGVDYDVLQLVSNVKDKKTLKDFLNNVYTASGIIAGGAAGSAGIKN